MTQRLLVIPNNLRNKFCSVSEAVHRSSGLGSLGVFFLGGGGHCGDVKAPSILYVLAAGFGGINLPFCDRQVTMGSSVLFRLHLGVNVMENGNCELGNGK